MKKFDVVTVGACIIDAFLTIHDADFHCRLNEKECELCVKYGEKIQVDSYDIFLGGNACNVAVGLKRLGFVSSPMAEIGDDEFAQKIINGLSKEGISSDLLHKTRGAKSSISFGIQFKGECTLFVSHTKRKHDFKFDDISTKWVYLTSLGREWINAYRRTLEFVRSSGAKFAFNPGSHQFEDGPESFMDALKMTDVLVVNKKEAQKIIKKQEEEPSKLIDQIMRLGTKTIAITDGINGSIASDGEGIFYIESFPAKAVAKPGTGDAYASGFVGALVSGLPIKEAMRWGSINSAAVIESLGTQEGLLTRIKLEEKLNSNPDFQAKQL